jgi:hypothetical protein
VDYCSALAATVCHAVCCLPLHWPTLERMTSGWSCQTASQTASQACHQHRSQQSTIKHCLWRLSTLCKPSKCSLRDTLNGKPENTPNFSCDTQLMVRSRWH